MVIRCPPFTAEMIRQWLLSEADDPLTMEEETRRILIVKVLWVMYIEDPDSIGLPGTQPRDRWDSMLGASYDEMIAAGVAVLWP